MSMDNYAKLNGKEVPVMNQAGIMGVLKVEFSRARRYNCPLACMLIQIDRFEYLRDLYGMEIAQTILDNVVDMINNNTRLSDFLGKVGDRFLLIMPHTDTKGAMILTNRIREKLATLDFDINGKLIKVTLSMGLADNAEEDSIFYDSILKRSETSLNKVINRGGDGLEIYKPKA